MKLESLKYLQSIVSRNDRQPRQSRQFKSSITLQDLASLKSTDLETIHSLRNLGIGESIKNLERLLSLEGRETEKSTKLTKALSSKNLEYQKTLESIESRESTKLRGAPDCRQCRVYIKPREPAVSTDISRFYRSS